MDIAELAKEHWGKMTSVGLGGGAGIMFLAKDAIKEWWAERHAERKAALEEARAAREEKKVQQGFGDKLANELLNILREDLRGNAALLKELTMTMGEFRDIMRVQREHSEEILILAQDTRESQKWVERLHNRRPDA